MGGKVEEVDGYLFVPLVGVGDGRTCGRGGAVAPAAMVRRAGVLPVREGGDDWVG